MVPLRFGGVLRVVAFLTEPAVVDRIIDHLKLQGHVERANRTHREEFYEVETIGSTLEEHNRQLERWADTYNTVRPHQSLANRRSALRFADSNAQLRSHFPGDIGLNAG